MCVCCSYFCVSSCCKIERERERDGGGADRSTLKNVMYIFLTLLRYQFSLGNSAVD